MPRSSVATNGPIATTTIRPLHGGALFLDFINTVDRTTDGPDSLPAFDELAPGYANLLAWAEASGGVDAQQAENLRRIARKDGRSAASVRRRAVALREALYQVIVALTEDTVPPPESLATIGDEIRLLLDAQHLAVIDGKLAFQTAPSRERDLDAVLRPVLQSAQDILSTQGAGRIRRCAAPDCRTLFLDGTKNGSRRFCSATGCGNVTRIRRFRAKQAASA
ncbi:MAG: CGNR zinc finger domain-containing protein [Thermomicrobiales bacterium]